MSALQVKAINQLTKMSLEGHLQFQHIVDNLFRNQVKYTRAEQNRIVKYLSEEAPIIIHFNLSLSLSHFLKDTMYRNCFEIEGKETEKYK